MNERIRELVIQAGLDDADFPIENWDNVPLAKFAELIVQDIFNVMNDQKTYNRCTYTTHDLDKAKCVVQEVIKCVNKHFGTKL